MFQHSMLVPSLSVVDNMALGGAWWRKPDRAGLAARMTLLCRALGVTLDPGALVGTLSLGERQQVEIVRALMRGSRVLILDEATAMLTPDRAEALGVLLRRLAARGLAVVLITHKIGEALAFSDRITVLRRGRVTGAIDARDRDTLDRKGVRSATLRLMFGSEVPVTDPEEMHDRPLDPAAAPTLVVRGLAAPDPVMPLHGVDLVVQPGEILGIAGIDGNGQKQLAEALAGQRALAAGSIMLDGRSIGALHVADRHALGLRYVTDDRVGEGTVATFPVAINLVLKDIGRPPFWRNGVERPRAIADHARRVMAAFDVRTPSVDTPIGVLSGGNIQKALLARELTGPARVVIFAKPTHGLDVNTTLATHRRIREIAQAGVAAILISTDLDELLTLSHRIAVMAGGRIVGVVTNDEAARHRLGAMMSAVAA